MSRSDTMPADHRPERMWTLSEDRTQIRLNVPPLPMAGLSKPLEVFVDFDGEAIDATISRLVDLRARMLPPPRRN